MTEEKLLKGRNIQFSLENLRTALSRIEKVVYEEGDAFNVVEINRTGIQDNKLGKQLCGISKALIKERIQELEKEFAEL